MVAPGSKSRFLLQSADSRLEDMRTRVSTLKVL